MERVSRQQLEQHLRVLTRDIGVRLAGSTADEQAAAYVADVLRQAGAEVRVETFPVRERCVTEEVLEVRCGSRWERFPCSLLSNAPGTAGATVAAPLVFFDAAAGSRRRDLSGLHGAAVVHFGMPLERAADYGRLMAAQPAFVLLVDVRYPTDQVTADALFPGHTHRYGAVPTVSVAYLDAWRWGTSGATEARLKVTGGMRFSRTQNVVADWPGTGPAADELLLLGAHYDTQADSVGADDNAVGVAALLEVARVLAPQPRRRTLRLIGFGAAEQRSVGSAHYVGTHRAELGRHGRFMLNLDACGSFLGWSVLICNGPPRLARWLLPFFHAVGQYPQVDARPTPSADHFPFVAAGVPGVTLTRHNCSAGRFFHHRPDEDQSRVSPALVAVLADAVAGALGKLTAAPRWPFPPRLDPAQRRAVAVAWRSCFGGWRGRG